MNFQQFLEDVDGGKAIQVCGEEMTKIVDSVQLGGGEGVLTITVKVKKHDGERAKIETKVASKIPTAPISMTTFFFHNKPDGDTSLTRDNPRQLKLKELPPQKRKDQLDAE